MKKKLITLLSPIAGFVARNKGETSLCIIMLAVTFVAALVASLFGASAPSAALVGACCAQLFRTAFDTLLDRLGLALAATPRPAVIGIAVATLLALAVL